MNKTFISIALAAVLSAAASLATAEIVVVVNPSNPATHMTPEQASQFFLGKSTMFTPVDQAESSAIRAEFYKKVADKDTTQVKAIWSKLVFTGKGTLPKELSSNADVKKAVAADPHGIGYIDKSAVDASVKVITSLP
jgi:ABC-type phosphate transport system substrate-binding protein